MREIRPPFQVLEVRDTRDFIEIGDRWVAVAGSGDIRQCDRCERDHEIHARVLDADGYEWIVGVGCMNAETAEVRRMAGQATRQAKAVAREVAAEAARAELGRLEAEVDGLVFPANEVIKFTTGEETEVWQVGDDGSTKVWVRFDADHDERWSCLVDVWRRKRLNEAAGGADALRKLRRKAGV